MITAALLFLITFAYLGYTSRSGSTPGLQNSKLIPCPDKPNCVNSEYPEDKSHYISPVALSKTMTMTKVKRLIEELGGKVMQQETHYLSATFSSALFGFTDNFEIRVDQANQLVQLRSASRVGHSDMGVNKQRVEQFKALLVQP